MRRELGRLLAITACLCCTLASPVSSSPLSGRWSAVETEHFLVVGDGKADVLRETAVELERVRSLLTTQLPSLIVPRPEPLLVFAAVDERTQAKLLPDIWGDGVREGPASLPIAVFRRSPYGRQIVLRTDFIRRGDHYGFVYHETFHALADDAGLDLPTWLEEGYAEVWGSGTRLRSRQAHTGRSFETRLIELRRARWIPFDELFAVHQTSAVGRNRSHSERFYAQAWALTHMLLFDDDRAGRSPEIDRYLELLDVGRPSLEAARVAFGDFERLRQRLRLYVNRRSHDFLRLPLPPEPDPETITTRTLSAGEAAAIVARHTSEAQPLDQLERLVAAALGASPGSRAFEAAGLMHARRGDVDAALESFEKALEQTEAAATDEATALSHYGVAVTKLARASDDEDGARDPSDDLSQQILQAAEAHLLEAVSLDGDFAPAYARLADVYRRLDDSPDRALALASRAARLRPDFAAYRLLVAQLLALSGEREIAHRRVDVETRAALASGDPGRLERLCRAGSLRGFAESVLPACDRAVAGLATSRSVGLDPASAYDSRGIARALAGDFGGAANDFRRVVASPGALDTAGAQRRGEWGAMLERGESPFADRHAILDDPSLRGIGWLE